MTYPATAIRGTVVQKHTLEIGTRDDGEMLVPYYCLDGEDISASTVCVKVDPVTWETTITKSIDSVGINWYDSVSFQVILYATTQKFKGTYTEHESLSKVYQYKFTGEPL